MIDDLAEKRIKHCYGVAKEMERIAREHYHFSEEKCKEMFMLGYLHDIGYEYTDKNPENHTNIGFNIAEHSGYKYSNEILNHGDPYTEYNSIALDILNTADLTVDSVGSLVGAEKRLNDIKGRYGDESTQYQNAYLLSKKLKLI